MMHDVEYETDQRNFKVKGVRFLKMCRSVDADVEIVQVESKRESQRYEKKKPRAALPPLIPLLTRKKKTHCTSSHWSSKFDPLNLSPSER